MQVIDNVFLIDDDVVSNLINSEIISSYNEKIRVNSFVSPISAFDEISELMKEDHKKIPQIIFLDINMPVSNGWEIVESLEKLKLMEMNCKVYILSSSIDSMDIERSNNYKIVKGYIAKPLTVAHLELLFE